MVIIILILKINRKTELSKVTDAISTLYTEVVCHTVLFCHATTRDYMCVCIWPVNLLVKLDGAIKEFRIIYYLHRLLNISYQLNVYKNQI